MLGSSRTLGGAAEHLIDGTKNAFVGRPLNFRVRLLLKGAVTGFLAYAADKSIVRSLLCLEVSHFQTQ